MQITVKNKQKDVPISIPQIKKIISTVISFEGQTADEVSVTFISDKEMCRMHADYFDDPSSTDCISFPMDDSMDVVGLRCLGDVFVCPATALAYTAMHSESNPKEEVILYVIHGLLHLMGYDDIDSKDRAKMRRAEKRHLNHLREEGLIISGE